MRAASGDRSFTFGNKMKPSPNSSREVEQRFAKSTFQSCRHSPSDELRFYLQQSDLNGKQKGGRQKVSL